MRFDVVTLFEELFTGFLATGMVRKAVASGALAARFRSPRAFGLGVHQSVDDTPYGGGSGMVLRADVWVPCMEALDADAPGGVIAKRILLTPQGAPFTQSTAKRLAQEPAIMLICGRYEGFDERIRSYVSEELSLGDFVMTGGEIAAMAIMDACVRLVPGVLGNDDSSVEESHEPDSHGLLEYPHYTRPLEYRGARVPQILQSGHHAQIAAWRREQAIERTKARRPDLFEVFRQHEPARQGERPNRASGSVADKAKGNE